MSEYFIGIDIGTTNIKSVLFDRGFKQVYVASRSNETLVENENYSEQCMASVYRKTLETLAEVANESGVDANGIKAIGFSGQGEGVWLVDEECKPVRNAIIWSDTRASELVKAISKKAQQEICQITGSTPLPGNMTMILAWLKENEPEALTSASHCFFAKDWVRYCLTGQIALDYSDTGTSVLDLETGKVSERVLEILGLSQYRGLLPDVAKGVDLVGCITSDTALKTGLSPKTKVVMGGLDVSCAALGMGAASTGDVFSILGTTCCTGVISEKGFNKGDGLRCVPHSLPYLYIDLIATLSGTPNLDWSIDNIALSKDFSDVERAISEVPVGCGGVWYHPYIAGERAPFFNENARASFFGINRNTTRAELLRAVYEGVSYTIKDALQGHGDGKFIYLAGGGANSNTWLQIIADITGRTVVVSADSELSAKGAAMLAAIGCDYVNDPKDNQYFTVGKTIKPILENVEKYNSYYMLYKQFQETAHPLWNMRSDLMEK